MLSMQLFELLEAPNLSYISDTSDSTDKLVNISNNGKSPPIEMTNEQHDSFFGNKED